MQPKMHVYKPETGYEKEKGVFNCIESGNEFSATRLQN